MADAYVDTRRVNPFIQSYKTKMYKTLHENSTVPAQACSLLLPQKTFTYTSAYWGKGFSFLSEINRLTKYVKYRNRRVLIRMYPKM